MLEIIIDHLLIILLFLAMTGLAIAMTFIVITLAILKFGWKFTKKATKKIVNG